MLGDAFCRSDADVAAKSLYSRRCRSRLCFIVEISVLVSGDGRIQYVMKQKSVYVELRIELLIPLLNESFYDEGLLIDPILISIPPLRLEVFDVHPSSKL